MQLVAKQSTAGLEKSDELHPLTLEFKTRYGLLKFHSNFNLNPECAVIISGAPGGTQEIYFVEPTEHLEAASETLRNYLGVNKQNVYFGTVIHLFQIPESAAVSIVIKIHDKANPYVAQYMGIDPYSPFNKVGEVPTKRQVDLVVGAEQSNVSAIA